MGVFFRKSIKLGKHTRLNLSKSGLGISTGVKGARIGANSKGKTYIAGGKDGIYFRKELGGNNKSTNNSYSTNQIKANDKLLRKRNSEITNKAVMKLIKMCLIVYFVVAIGDAATLQSTVLLWIVGIIDVVICFGTMFTIIKKRLQANKEGKIIGEDL
ncbi:DUF4236 domain-containing protein [Clostridium arbusti]|uniref:DUF4236 domain-containing protein n=1 Tax=Clostridium arbusti TaxID=1137848 RepID=UPI000288BC58|nr:DUF4236 domain-containing protein [Clostridium arbusti]